jgi:hypothetical protein
VLTAHAGPATAIHSVAIRRQTTMPSMPQPVADDQDDHSSAEEIVLGVDTHSEVHVAVVLSTLGARLSSTNFPATAAGYRALLAWRAHLGPPAREDRYWAGRDAADVQTRQGLRSQSPHPNNPPT